MHGRHSKTQGQLFVLLAASQRSESSAVVGRADHVRGAHETYVQVEALQQGLCGRSRPTFFRGVATVGTLADTSLPYRRRAISAMTWTLDVFSSKQAMSNDCLSRIIKNCNCAHAACLPFRPQL